MITCNAYITRANTRAWPPPISADGTRRITSELAEHNAALLARDGELAVFEHKGFWHCMDTVRDMESLNQLWASGKAPWNKR